MDVFYSWPPVTRTLVAATVVTSLLVHTGTLDFYYVAYVKERVFTTKITPEIWRLVSGFLITGPKFGLLMDPYFLFTYGSQLERGSPRFTEPGSFLVYLLFIMTGILTACSTYLGGFLFLQPLIIAFAYTFAQDNPNSNVTIYILTFPAKFLPYALLALAVVMESPAAAKSQASGLLAAHLYDFLTRIWPTFGGGTNYITTPYFVKKMFVEDASAPQARTYGTAFAARQPTTGNASGNSWSNTRGPGRRLGD